MLERSCTEELNLREVSQGVFKNPGKEISLYFKKSMNDPAIAI